MFEPNATIDYTYPMWVKDNMDDVPKKVDPTAIEKRGGYKWAYGIRFDEDMADWMIELQCYNKNKQYRDAQKKAGIPIKILPGWKHFINWALHLYGPGCDTQFTWHPWAVRMIKSCCMFQYVGMAGASSCGKSEFMGLWVLGNLLADYDHTMCLVTTQSIREAHGRIWGSVLKYYNALPDGIVGVLLKYTEHPTPTIKVRRNGQWANNAGIRLIPADSSQTGTKTNKMQGLKAHKNRNSKSRVFLAGDEMTELSHALVDTMKNNLSNNDVFHAIAAANPNSKYDAFAVFVKPKYGWAQIHVEMEWWEMEIGGVCLHFDALKNPNYVARQNIWPMIQHFAKVDGQIADAGGKNTPRFWRNCRAFWPPNGAADNGIYSEAEITQGGGDQVYQNFDPARPKLKWAGVDTAFAEGGDRCVMMLADTGKELGSSKDVVSLDRYIELVPDTDVIGISTELQIARKIIGICEEEGIAPERLGIDSTGAGATFCSILMDEWKLNTFHRASFAGAATLRPVSDLDDTPSNQKYGDRSSEIWFAGKEMLRHGQLFGLSCPKLVTELTSRKHTTAKSTDGNTVIRLESKKELRKRTGCSPDIADGMAVVLDTIRERGGFKGSVTEIENDQRGPENFAKFVKSRCQPLLADRRLSTTREVKSPGAATMPTWGQKKQPHFAMRRLSGR